MVCPAVGAGIEQRHMLSLQIACDIWPLVGIAEVTDILPIKVIPVDPVQIIQ
jgi:hypothetical protein